MKKVGNGRYTREEVDNALGGVCAVHLDTVLNVFYVINLCFDRWDIQTRIRPSAEVV